MCPRYSGRIRSQTQTSSSALLNDAAVVAWQKKDEEWRKKNELAEAAILAKTESLSGNLVKGTENASEMWSIPKNTFKVINPQMRNNFKMELHNLRLRSGSTMIR